jgi:hypothetical protein
LSDQAHYSGRKDWAIKPSKNPSIIIVVETNASSGAVMTIPPFALLF